MAASSNFGGVHLNFLEQVKIILNRPSFQQKCEELSKLIEEASSKDLHSVYSTIVESVIGFSTQLGWGLNRISQTMQNLDFQIVKAFLAPEGPFMKMVYKLLVDPNFAYDFPVSCLPGPSRHLIDEGAIPNLYMNKVTMNMYTHTITSVSLNAFEYYFFHFAYMLVNPQLKNQSNWTNPADILYTKLLEEYLTYFFPTQSQHITPMPAYASPIKSPVAYKSPQIVHRQSPSMYSRPPSPPQHKSPFSGLFKQSPALSRSMSLQNTALETSEHETWRSEFIVQAFTEFWLNQNGNLQEKQGLRQQVMENILASPDHVRVVRMFVKHMHFFSNSAQPNVIVPSYQTSTGHVTPLEELKRSVIPHIMKKPLYLFLRHAFDRWPLDSSFRLVLETWLSYIQPWRYTSTSSPQSPTGHSDMETTNPIDAKWHPFIADNFLFYTHLFQEFLQRIFRMDLSSAKNAYMLFRVSKVFSQSDLAPLLEEVESSLYEAHGQDAGNSYLSHSPSSLTAVVTLRMAELEGPGFKYTGMFCDPSTRKKIEKLLPLVMQAKQNVMSTQTSNTNGGSSLLRWLGFGPMMDYNAERYSQSAVQDEPFDAKKVQQHLIQSIQNLCKVFNIQVDSLSFDVGKQVSWGQSDLGNGHLLPDYIDTPEGPSITPLGRYQMMTGLRKFDITYQGDPDLQPVRSYESSTLVRFFYNVSTYINDRFSSEIIQLHERDDFIGRFICVFFKPSTTSLSREKSSPVSHHYTPSSQPRISLRALANYQNIGYLAGLYFLFYIWFGTNPVSFMFLLIIGVIIYGILIALIRRSSKVKLI